MSAMWSSGTLLLASLSSGVMFNFLVFFLTSLPVPLCPKPSGKACLKSAVQTWSLLPACQYRLEMNERILDMDV